MKDMELETLENPNNSKFEATFIAAGQLPSGCGTMQMKLQEHRMASPSHLSSAGSPEDQRESASWPSQETINFQTISN